MGGCFPGPGLAPAGDLLSFASPKESSQRKGDPAVCVPSLRYGQPAVLDVEGGPQNSLRSNSCGPDPLYICAPRRSQKGLKTKQAIAALGVAVSRAAPPRSGSVAPRAERSNGPSGSPPLWLRRGAERFADQGSPLFERSEFGRDPAKREHRRLPAAKRRDAASGVAFSLLTFFWRSKRKQVARRGETRPAAFAKPKRTKQPANAR